MIKKPTRIAIALILALGLVFISASIAVARPQPSSEIVNLHLDGTSLHFQLHLVNLHQAFYYKVGIRHNDGSPVTDTAFSPIGKLSREGNSAEISRGIASFGGVSGHYDVQVELFNRKQVSLGSTPTATYTCYFTVTFHETNGLPDVTIQVYSDSALQDPIGDPLATNSSGEATIKLPNGTFYWAAAKANYFATGGNFSLSDAPFTVNFEMALSEYAVTFNETNGLSDVEITIWDAGWNLIDVISTNTSGQATIDLPNGEYPYSAAKSGYASAYDDFAVSGSAQTISFTMNAVYTVTFNETNSLPGVDIDIYLDGYGYLDYVTTNETGQATIDLPDGNYTYFASKTGYGSINDEEFVVSGSAQTINFTMSLAYTVTLSEANNLQYVYIEIYNSGEEKMAELETDASGNVTIDLRNDTYDFYAYMEGYMDFDGNFTVSGENLTVPFEMISCPIVTFDETNGLSDVYIKVYEDWALANFMTSFWTDSYGQASMQIYESGTYYYEATQAGYGSVVGDFTVSVSNITESFTMETGYYVGFAEANSVAATLQLFSDSGLTVAASTPFATDEYGNATIELANATYYYKATRIGFDDCTGNFTVSGETLTVPFEMIPTAGVIFVEDFTAVAGPLPVGWTRNSTLCRVVDSRDAGGYAPELQLWYGPDLDTYYDYYVATPPINATGISGALNLSFKTYFSLYGDNPERPYTYAVQTSDDDGATWTTVLEESPTLDTYPDYYFQRTENIDISACAGKTFRICWRLYGYTWWMNYWNIDDILVTGETGGLVTGIGSITGTPEVGQTLAAGTLTPPGATATYQWQSCNTAGGSYADISGATNSTYMLVGDDLGMYIKVQATGTGSYTGTVTSGPTAPVTTPLTGIGAIAGTFVVGETLSGGALSPAGATATYQWQRFNGSIYVDISGATNITHTLGEDDFTRYVRLVATGSGDYTGQVTSAETPQIKRALSGIGTIIGTPEVGRNLTAGALSPAGADATYQWQRCDTVGGTYANITGEISDIYVLASADLGKYIKVAATGTGLYTGTVTSAATAKVTTPLTGIGAIIGTPVVGQNLTAGALTPVGATATYQWWSAPTVGGPYTDSGATSNTYNLVAGDLGKFFKVLATGTGSYTGTVASAAKGPVTTPLTGIGAITGTAVVGQTLTAGALSPAGATATYQWQRCATEGGSYMSIEGANSNTYLLLEDDSGYYIKVEATGSGNYTGIVASAATTPVAAETTPLTDMGAMAGSPIVGNALTAGALSPEGATATYQWQLCDTVDGTYADISTATSNTYVTVEGDVGKYVKVVATGSGAYAGQAISEPRKVWAAGPLFVEDFYGVPGHWLDPHIPVGWTLTGTTSQLAFVNPASSAGGEAPQLEFDYDWGPGEAYNRYSDYRISTLAINATGATSALNLSFKSYFDIWDFRDDYPFTLAVEVSTDGGTTWNATSYWITINASSETTYPSYEIGPETVNIDLEAYKGQTIKISWRLYGYTYQANAWYMDDVVVTGS